MFLIRLYRYLFGYVRIDAGGDFPERIINVFAKNKIMPWEISRNNNHIEMCLFNKDFIKLYRIKPKGIKIKIIKKCGLKNKLKRYKIRYGLILGMAFYIGFLIFLSNFIWQIDVVGNVTVKEREILNVCREYGIESGTPKSKIDTALLKEKLSIVMPETAWMALNIEGCRLTVNISEIKNNGIVKPPSNIVSAYDGVVKEIKISSGSSNLKPGQAVRKGELLISGIVDNGKTQKFISAKGEIIGQVEKKFEFVKPYITNEKIHIGRPKTKCVLEFFSLKIPLYLGEYNRRADTVFKYDYLRFLGTKTPILIYQKKFNFYEIYQRKYSEEALIKEMENDFAKALENENIENPIIKEQGIYRDENSVKMVYVIEFQKNIGISENLLFQFNN